VRVIQRLLIQHFEVSRLSDDLLVHRRVVLAVAAIIMRVYQVALNIHEGLFLNARETDARGAGAHGRVIFVIDEAADDVDSYQAEVLQELDNVDNNQEAGKCAPALLLVAVLGNYDHLG